MKLTMRMDKESGQFGFLGAIIGFISQAWTWLGTEIDWGGIVTAGINVFIGTVIALLVKHYYNKYFALNRHKNIGSHAKDEPPSK